MNRALRAVSTGMLIVAQLILDQKLWGANKNYSAHHARHVHTSTMMAESEESPSLLPLPPLPVPPSLAELHSHWRMWLYFVFMDLLRMISLRRLSKQQNKAKKFDHVFLNTHFLMHVQGLFDHPNLNGHNFSSIMWVTRQWIHHWKALNELYTFLVLL